MPQDIQSFKRARAASRDEQAVWMRFIRMFKRNKTLRYIFIVILFLFIIFYTWATLSLEKLNEIGDAFNILNTFFTALAFIGLILTILLQRKDLALQREELKLQREEMQRQCEEQKRQADEFEEQNRLMKIQQFESFFFKQLEYLDYLSKNIRVYGNRGTGAINKIAENIKPYAEIVKNINNLDTVCKYFSDFFECNKQWSDFQNVYNDILPWVHKFYSFIIRIKNMNMLNEDEKKFYIETVFENLFDTQKYVLQIMGCVSSVERYSDMERLLDDENFFEMKTNDIFGDRRNIKIFKDALKTELPFIIYMCPLYRKFE